MATVDLASRPAAPPLPPLLWNVLRRGVPTSILCAMTIIAAAGIPDARSGADVLFGALSAGLWGLFAAMTLIRSAPRRRGPIGIGVAAAVGAQGAMVVIGTLAHDHRQGATLVLGDVLLLVGIAFTLVSVSTLGRCFGVLPDARGMVTRGPYRFVRHPVYLGELVVTLGFVVPARSWLAATAALAVLVVAQLVRIRYEETTLQAEFPEYAAYAQRTRRLIPGVV